MLGIWRILSLSHNHESRYEAQNQALDEREYVVIALLLMLTNNFVKY